MGYTQAIGFADAVGEGLASLDGALRYQLFTNHYPPLPPETLELSKEALKLAAQDKWDEAVDFGPSGISHRVYGTQVPVRAVIEAWHLEPFVGLTRGILTNARIRSFDEEE